MNAVRNMELQYYLLLLFLLIECTTIEAVLRVHNLRHCFRNIWENGRQERMDAFGYIESNHFYAIINTRLTKQHQQQLYFPHYFCDVAHIANHR